MAKSGGGGMRAYEVRGVVGEGAYGVVIKCRHRTSGATVAIKKFRESEDDEAVRKTAVREVKILRMLRHESIVTLHEAFRRKGRLYLVFEFMPRNMLEFLEDHRSGLAPQLARRYVRQLAAAVEWCHQHRVVHRDIKPENLLVDPARATLRLCDFGFARMLPPDGRAAALTDYVATRWYRSPELLLASTSYGYEVDVWSIGCIMAELLDGQALFPGESDIDQLYIIQTVLGRLTERQRDSFLSNPLFTGKRVPEPEEGALGLAAKYEARIGGTALDFLAGTLELDPAARRTAEQCVEDPMSFAPGDSRASFSIIFRISIFSRRDILPTCLET